MNEPTPLPSSPEPASEATPDELRYAGFWIRFGAYFIDILITLAVIAGLLFVKSPVIYLFGTIVLMFYKPLFEGLKGATPGKMLLGLLVRQRDLGKIGLVTAFIRSAVFILPGIVSTLLQYKQKVAGIGLFDPTAQKAFQEANMSLTILSWALTAIMVVSCVVVAFNARKRGLHDLLAETVVVYRESLPRS